MIELSNAYRDQVLLLPQCFQNVSSDKGIERVCLWERVKVPSFVDETKLFQSKSLYRYGN